MKHPKGKENTMLIRRIERRPIAWKAMILTIRPNELAYHWLKFTAIAAYIMFYRYPIYEVSCTIQRNCQR